MNAVDFALESIAAVVPLNHYAAVHTSIGLVGYDEDLAKLKLFTRQAIASTDDVIIYQVIADDPVGVEITEESLDPDVDNRPDIRSLVS